MSEFDPPPGLRTVLEQLHKLAVRSGLTAYVVGGTVRDVLLRRGTGDVDLAVDRDAIAWSRAVADATGGHFVLLDDAHQIARIIMPGAASLYIDVAQLRGTIEEDLRGRDFTVDALAAPLGGGAIIDVCGGLADLGAHIVRMNAPGVFDDDRLRLLRGVRIAAELGFGLEPETRLEIRRRAMSVNGAAAERRRDELARIMALDRAYPALLLLDDAGLLEALLPEVAAGRGVTQPADYHAYDVFEHNMRTVEALERMLAPAPALPDDWMWHDFWAAFGWCEEGLRASLAGGLSEGRRRLALLKVAALLHDVAKPETRAVQPDGRVRFFGHADLGADMARKIMRRLRFSAKECTFVALLVAEHLRPVQLSQIGEAPTRRALYRFHRELGDAALPVLLLALADAASARGASMSRDGWRRQVAYMNGLLVRSVQEEGIVRPPKILSGHDIMSEFGVAQGPELGRVLEALREAQAAGEVRNQQEGRAFVRELLSRSQ